MESKPSSRSTRNRFSLLLRQLFTGRITNDDFDDAATDLIHFDLAVDQVYRLGAWPGYDDTRCYYLKGKDALPREDRKHVARWILFLKTGLPYRWGSFPELSGKYLGALCLLPVPTALYFWRWELIPLGFILILAAYSVANGIYAKLKRPAFEARGDIQVWPFISKADYEAALKQPPYLCGSRSA